MPRPMLLPWPRPKASMSPSAMAAPSATTVAPSLERPAPHTLAPTIAQQRVRIARREGARVLRVTAKDEIAQGITLFELRDPDGAELPPAQEVPF